MIFSHPGTGIYVLGLFLGSVDRELLKKLMVTVMFRTLVSVPSLKC